MEMPLFGKIIVWCALMIGLTSCGFAQRGIMQATGADKQVIERQERLKAEQEERRQQNLSDQQRIYREEFLASEARQACRANPTPECIAKTGIQPDIPAPK